MTINPSPIHIPALQTSTQSDPMPYEALMQRIWDMEAQYDLLGYQVDGWCVWPLLQLEAARALQNLPLIPKQEFPVKERFSIAAKDMLALISVPQARYVVKTNSLPRTEQQAGKYKDIYFDDLLLVIGSFFKIEDAIYKVFNPNDESMLIKSNMTTMGFKVIVSTLMRLGGPASISGTALSLASQLGNESGMETFTPTRVTRKLLHFYWSKKLYAWLLCRIQPDYILMITAHNDHALVAAAKEQGISVIEFQHGTVYKYSPGYSWSPYALKYKSKMPIPDRLFLYGEYWRQELACNGFWGEELRSVGSIRMDHYRSLDIPKDKQNHKTIIAVTAQGMDTTKLIAFLMKFLALAKDQLDFYLYFKLHPGDQHGKDVYASNFGANDQVCILSSREQPSTFELLKQADFHVSIASTCHYEALALGVPTIILSLAGHETAQHLCESGHAFLAHTPQDMINIIKQQGHDRVPPQVGDLYFKPGALESIQKELGIL